MLLNMLLAQFALGRLGSPVFSTPVRHTTNGRVGARSPGRDLTTPPGTDRGPVAAVG